MHQVEIVVAAVAFGVALPGLVSARLESFPVSKPLVAPAVGIVAGRREASVTPNRPAVAFTIHQRRQARFDRLLSPIPAILLVCAGRKVVTVGAHRIEACAGMFLALPEHTEMTIENVPAPDRPYEARAIAMPRGEFDAAYATLRSRRSRFPSVPTVKAHAPLLRHFERTTRALRGAESIPSSVARLMVHQLVVWLAEEGLILAPARPPTVPDRVRMLIADDLPGGAGRPGASAGRSR